MEKTYNPSTIESRWYQYWESHNHFAPDGQGEPYCIMIPPPNVTGTLHMGHAFQDTIMDALIRYHRMKGFNTLWQPGTDHAGIATQMVVERQLNAAGQTRHDLGRDKFIDKVWAWKEESGGIITNQLRRMGASPDWQRERFTMDEGMSAAVQEVFIRLHEQGLIYRGKRLVNWDPVLHTALSDLEVLNEEENGHLWHFRYPISDGGHLVVATTRPETMLGDSAVAVNPTDERYKDLVGKEIDLPLTGRRIPIIADDYVDPEFGSGCVKITPAHDFNDYQVGLRHSLEQINILTDDAALNDNCPEAYRGLDRYEARKRIVADFEAAGLLEKIDDHVMKVPRGDRSGSVVEPYLTDQWFVDLTRDTTDDGQPGGKTLITIPSIEAVRSGRIRFVPENWEKTYFQWLENIQDWCISRQLWWGHRIPAWYDNDSNIYVGENESAIRQKHGLADSIELVQDEDVLDTWFSSALWPFSTLGWPEKTDALKTWYPGSVLVTGFDIIFFWVARMIMFGTHFMDGEVPFREVYMHGLVRDAQGQKMSKTKGNVLDPIDIIDGIELNALVEKRTSNLMQPHMAPAIEEQTRQDFPEGIAGFGTDALRFTFASLASTGRDIRFDIKRVEGSRNFCNKLYNATRFVLMNTADQELDCPTLRDSGLLASDTAVDRWIYSRLNETAAEVNQHIVAYRFDLASNALYEFIWNEYCDWYVEMTKPLLNESDAGQQKRTRSMLVHVLESVLRLSHPLMPYITEELWHQVAPLAKVHDAQQATATIMRQPYPVDDGNIDKQAMEEINWVKSFVIGVRKIRSEQDINPGKRLEIYLDKVTPPVHKLVDRNVSLIRSLGRIESINFYGASDKRVESAVALVDATEIHIPLAGLIDKTAELTRLDKEITRLNGEVTRLSKKLDNQGFIGKAPPAVVEQERQKLSDASSAREKLLSQRDKIAAM